MGDYHLSHSAHSVSSRVLIYLKTHLIILIIQIENLVLSALSIYRRKISYCLILDPSYIFMYISCGIRLQERNPLVQNKLKVIGDFSRPTSRRATYHRSGGSNTSGSPKHRT